MGVQSYGVRPEAPDAAVADRKHRKYSDWQSIGMFSIIPYIGLRIEPMMGCYLVHVGGDHVPHCVAVHVEEDNETCVVYDGEARYRLVMLTIYCGNASHNDPPDRAMS